MPRTRKLCLVAELSTTRKTKSTKPALHGGRCRPAASFTSGIGLELARALLSRGNTVIVTGRDQGRLERTKRALPGAHGYQSDVSDTEFAKELKGQRAMDPAVLPGRAVAAIKAGQLEIRPGQSNLLKMMSRIAPGFAFSQLAKMGKSKAA